MKIKIAIALIFLCAFSASSQTVATTKPTPTPEPPPIEDTEVLKVDTEEVTLNVRVEDKNRRFVGNLKAANFQVFEDGELQPLTALSTIEVPTINALLIDNSRSLRSQLKEIAEAGKIIIGANRHKDESAVIRFVSSDNIEFCHNFSSDKTSLNYALDNLSVEGGQTAIIDAIYFAVQKIEQYKISDKKEDVKIRSLILVTDGYDRGSLRNAEQLFELLRKSNVQIYTIGFINELGKNPFSKDLNRKEKAKSFLTRLSEESGGKVYFPNSLKELSGIATEILGELRTQYLVSYSPTNDLRDGKYRTIKVLINGESNQNELRAITRTGRQVSKN